MGDTVGVGSRAATIYIEKAKGAVMEGNVQSAQAYALISIAISLHGLNMGIVIQ